MRTGASTLTRTPTSPYQRPHRADPVVTSVEAYVFWTRKFILFHGKRHPDTMGEAEVTSFLTYLAVTRKVAPSTQNQALGALLFLYRRVLGRDLEGVNDAVRAKPAVRVPVVLSPAEVGQVLRHLRGLPALAALLMYGSGLRLMECLKLRVQDIDFDRGEIVVREGKGRKDRRTLLPTFATAQLRAHLAKARQQHESETRQGLGRAFLPEAIQRRQPEAATDWAWQWVFPASRFHAPAIGPRTRHHLHETAVQRAFALAVLRSGIAKKATCHSLRHSFATQLLEASYNIRTIQELLGHRSVSTTMIYTHPANQRGPGVRSPLDVRSSSESPPCAAIMELGSQSIPRSVAVQFGRKP